MHHIRPLENPEYVSVTEWKFCQYLTTPHRKKMLKRQIHNSQYMYYLKLSLLYSTKKIYISFGGTKNTPCVFTFRSLLGPIHIQKSNIHCFILLIVS